MGGAYNSAAFRVAPGVGTREDNKTDRIDKRNP